MDRQTKVIDEVRRRLPMAIQRIQTDHGSEFGTDYTWHLQDVGLGACRTARPLAGWPRAYRLWAEE